MLKQLKIWIPVALAVMMLLAGCIDDVYPDEPLAEKQAERRPTSVFLRLHVDLAAGMPGASRAGEQGGAADPLLPADSVAGTSRENAVNSVYVLVYNVDDRNPANDTLVDVAVLGRSQLANITGTGAVIDIDVVDQQKLRVYAAVNFTPRMRDCLMNGGDYDTDAEAGTPGDLQAAFSSDKTDYWDVINEFIPGSYGMQTKLEADPAGGIPMTGQFLVNGSFDDVIQITPEYCTIETALNLTATVRRMVAKIHVVAQTDSKYPEYVIAKDNTIPAAAPTAADANDPYAGWLGWIRLESVRYIPNATNKSTYLFPQRNDAANKLSEWKDKNMDLDHYYHGRILDEPTYNGDYVTYHGVSLHKVNISPDDRMEQAESSDDARWAENAANPYTRGMYCLENYFDQPVNSDYFSTYDDALPIVTHVYIAARLIPRDIVLKNEQSGSNYADRITNLVTAYEDSPSKFYADYGLSPSDFTDEDVEYWNNTIRPRYFPQTEEEKNKQEAQYKGKPFRDIFAIYRMASQTDAYYILKWSLISTYLWSNDPQAFETDRYPAFTYYVYDRVKYDKVSIAEGDVLSRYLFFAPGALFELTGDNANLKTYSVPHIGGWGYYYTYLDQLGTTAGGRTPYTASQVTRNTYYLVNVTNFGTPGGTITRPEYIKANTLPVGWDYAGRGSITLH